MTCRFQNDTSVLKTTALIGGFGKKGSAEVRKDECRFQNDTVRIQNGRGLTLSGLDLRLFWACSGLALGLLWACSGLVLGFFWASSGLVLWLLWACSGLVLGLF